MIPRLIEPKVVKHLYAVSTKEHIPISGTFELTPMCNMKCEMCYVRMSKDEIKESGGRFRKKAEWIKLAQDAKEQGIGFGYSEEEYFTISNCKSYNNKKFGFFFEHQGRFSTRKYAAESTKGFLIQNCEASGSYYNYGGLLTMNTTYENCISSDSVQHGFFFENSKNCTVMNCTSSREGNTCFVILQSGTDGGNQEVTNINYQNCSGSDSPYGIKIRSYNSSAKMDQNSIQGCEFTKIQDQVVFTSGKMLGMKLENNISDNKEISLNAVVDDFINIGNSWND